MDTAKDLYFAYQALMSLFSATNKLQSQGDKYLGDLTVRQVLAIPTIFHAPDGGATFNHIARQLGTTKQNVRQIVDALEKKGYLSVEGSEGDKRSANVKVTESGGEALAVSSGRMDEFLADVFHEFTTEELEILCIFLKKLSRFDGGGASEESAGYNAGNANEALRHHPKFEEKRGKKTEQ